MALWQVEVSPPTFECHHSGIGVSTATPRVSWRFRFAPAPVYSNILHMDWKQAAYELQIRPWTSSKSEGTIDESHTTYHIRSSENVLVPWPGPPLRSRAQVFVRVRAFGSTHLGSNLNPTNWSMWSTVECAFLESRECWIARPITASFGTAPAEDDEPLRPILFRKKFQCPSTKDYRLRKARLYITAQGVYEAHINGVRVGDEVLGPGWTSYRHRLSYRVFDVTELLSKPTVNSDLGPEGQSCGKTRDINTNVLAVQAAEGWYAGRLGWGSPGKRYHYGSRIAILAQLEMYYAQHSGEGNEDTGQANLVKHVVVTDETWQWHPSPIIRSELYNGELYDVRQELWGWKSPDFSTQEGLWKSAKAVDFDLNTKLISPNAPPIREVEILHPKSIFTSATGKAIIDFGQNVVGKLRIRQLSATSNGHRLCFVHAEALENGEVSTRPLRTAKCTDELILSSSSLLRDWTPKFTFHGFRYVEISGWDSGSSVSPALSEETLDNISAVVLHTDMERTGHFKSSHKLLNKLHENTVWSMRGNFVSIPTDCPQRDERLGWTGDIAIFTPSANFLYNTASILSSWMDDVLVEQMEPEQHGTPPLVVPNVIGHLLPSRMPQAVWGDVTVLTPWALYQSFGDKEMLRRQYHGMLTWFDTGIQRGADGLWDENLWQLGDWLDPKAPPSEPGDARTNGTLVADAYLVRITNILAKISNILGYDAQAKRYNSEAARLKQLFQHKYMAPSGLVVGDTQTAISLVIVFELYANNSQLQTLGNRLVNLIRAARFRVATGFVGTPLITHALTAIGNVQLAYRLLLETNCPSWLYPVTMGATTIWERWDSMLPDGSVSPGSMTSFNHYALGSIVEWLHAVVGGLSPKDPGWKKFWVRPRPGGTLRSAEVTLETPYGTIECGWSLHVAIEPGVDRMDSNEVFQLDLVVPPNAEALVVLPAANCVGADSPTTDVDTKEARKVGAGKHFFTCNYVADKGHPFVPIVPYLYDIE